MVAQATDAPEDVQAVFSKAVQLLNAGHYAEAVPLLEDVTRRAPDRPGGFMNLGLAAAESGDHPLALRAWSRYHELVPDDTKAFGKIIQAYQALGQPKERDQVRDQLIAYRNSLPPEQREQFLFYIRDQFDVAGQRFMVFEYFEPKSPTRMYYKFLAVDANHKPVYNFTLTSGDADTSVAQQLGEVGKDDRIYALDRNEGTTSSLCGMLTTLSYDTVRSLVIKSVEGRAGAAKAMAPSLAESPNCTACDPTAQTTSLRHRLESMRNEQPGASLSFTGLNQEFAVHHSEIQLRLHDCTYDVAGDVSGLIDILLAAKITVGYPLDGEKRHPEARFGVYFGAESPDGIDLWFSNPAMSASHDQEVLGQSHDRAEVTAYKIKAAATLRAALWEWAHVHGYPRKDTATACQLIEKYASEPTSSRQ